MFFNFLFSHAYVWPGWVYASAHTCGGITLMSESPFIALPRPFLKPRAHCYGWSPGPACFGDPHCLVFLGRDLRGWAWPLSTYVGSGSPDSESGLRSKWLTTKPSPQFKCWLFMIQIPVCVWIYNLSPTLLSLLVIHLWKKSGCLSYIVFSTFWKLLCDVIYLIKN